MLESAYKNNGLAAFIFKSIARHAILSWPRLGMKTASFALADRLTVVSRSKKDKPVGRCWDLETIKEENIYNLTNSFSKEIIEKGNCEKSQDYLINCLTKMNEPISMFFDNVIVNHNDYTIKTNRLKLLKNLHNLILKFSIFEFIED